MTFQAGDTVRVKSGGPKMTVESVQDTAVTTVWFDGTKLCREKFTEALLEDAPADFP
jgi:uncharacterized protein YodC (DUF2158 family)